MNPLAYFVPFLTLAAISQSAMGEVRLSPIFGDHMVIQREAQASIWGTASPGEPVKVHASWGATAEGMADESGTWKVFLKTQEAGGPHQVTIRGVNEITLKEVLLGDVWLMAGQSNMGHPLEQCANAAYEIRTSEDPGLRLTVVATQVGEQPMDQLAPNSKWNAADPKTVPWYGAVAYHFGRSLRGKLNVPIGLVGVWMGGTPIETWLPLSAQENDPRAIAYRKEWQGKIEKIDPLIEKQAWEKRNEQWQKLMADWEAGGRIGIKPWCAPMKVHPSKDHGFPSNLYNGMIHPVRHLAAKGVVWYQGEGNAHNREAADHYRVQLAALVSSWRSAFQQDLPFVFAQLPFFKQPVAAPAQVGPAAEESWQLVREGILEVSRNTPKCALAVLLDLGDVDDIHPRRKRPAGERLAMAALKEIYQKSDSAWTSPVPVAVRKSADGYQVDFENGGAPLVVQGGGELKGFAIQQADGTILAAKAKLVSPATVWVQSHPQGAMLYYAWASNPAGANLYNEADLPASPFRWKIE